MSLHCSCLCYFLTTTMVKKIIAETNVNAEEKTVSAMNGTMLWRKRCWHCEGLVFNRELFSYLIWKTTSHNGLYAEFHSLVRNLQETVLQIFWMMHLESFYYSSQSENQDKKSEQLAQIHQCKVLIALLPRTYQLMSL